MFIKPARTIIPLILMFLPQLLSANEISGIRVADREEFTRLVLDSAELPKFHITEKNAEKKYSKIIFTIDKSAWHGNISGAHYHSWLLQEVAFKADNNGNLVFNLDFFSAVKLKAISIIPPDNAAKFYRMVIDVIPDEAKVYKGSGAPEVKINAAVNKPVGAGLPLSMQHEKPNAPIAAPDSPPGPTKTIIVIDPGHGGIDPGTIGDTGLKEKNITLQYARELRDDLQKTGRYKVYLTRNKDEYVGLKERAEKARDLKADLFISLHADSNPDANLRGLSVYTLSPARAEKQMEKLEGSLNKTTALSKIDLKAENSDTADVLIDLMQAENRNSSARFAETLVRELGSEAQLLQHSHRFAGFMVLTGIDVPSVLIELGYLSNAYEEKTLAKPEYRKKLVKALVKAVNVYFKNAG